MFPAVMRPNQRVLAASILGSGAVFLESTVVTVALPAIGRDFDLGLDAAGFAVTSALCALAPGAAMLSVLRFVQGIAGALLVPNSLALIEETFSGEARGVAIGKWAAGSAGWTALRPLIGGAIVSAASWRWVFALVVPFALAAALVLPSGRADTRQSGREGRVDYLGAVLVTAALGILVGAMIAGPTRGFSDPLVIAGLVGGAVLLATFLIYGVAARIGAGLASGVNNAVAPVSLRPRRSLSRPASADSSRSAARRSPKDFDARCGSAAPCAWRAASSRG